MKADESLEVPVEIKLTWYVALPSSPKQLPMPPGLSMQTTLDDLQGNLRLD